MYFNRSLQLLRKSEILILNHFHRSISTSKFENARSENADNSANNLQFEKDVLKYCGLEIFKTAINFPERIALKDQNAEFAYGELFFAAQQLSTDIGKLSSKLHL